VCAALEWHVLQCGHGPETVENVHGRRLRERLKKLASMRPRSGDRGEQDAAAWAQATLTMLQCGHGPETVENHVPGDRFGQEHLKLQCGHGPETVENGGGSGVNVSPIRGLQCGHGPETVENGILAHRAPASKSASMRPRSGDRGEP